MSEQLTDGQRRYLAAMRAQRASPTGMAVRLDNAIAAIKDGAPRSQCATLVAAVASDLRATPTEESGASVVLRLLKEAEEAHRTPPDTYDGNPFYNVCEEEPCAWCEAARAEIARMERAIAPGDKDPA